MRILDRFSNRTYRFLIASLVMGVFRGIWHLPLLVYEHIPWYDVVFLSLAVQLIITWVYLSIGGSVLIVMLLHLSSNVIGGSLFMLLFSGPDQVRFYQLVIFFAWVFALLLLLVSGKNLGRQVKTAGVEAQGSLP